MGMPWLSKSCKFLVVMRASGIALLCTIAKLDGILLYNLIKFAWKVVIAWSKGWVE